jgi:hypothetical protein
MSTQQDWWQDVVDSEGLEHECNDCGIMIPSWRPICTLCEKWYEERGLPLPELWWTRHPSVR